LTNWKPKTYRDKEYLQFIREQLCVICGTTPCQPHHLNQKGIHSGGLALKISDYRTIPFCALHHSEYHTIGRQTMEKKYGKDFRELLINTLEKGILKYRMFNAG
jgi:hypothetical protein